MYLALLNDKEKELFLGLAYGLAASDGEYSEAERATIAGYCQEMMVGFDETTMIKQIDDIIVEFAQIASDKVKKIIIFEAIGLAMSDNSYDTSEREIIRKMSGSFGVEVDYADTCEAMLNEYISFQNKLNTMVIG